MSKLVDESMVLGKCKKVGQILKVQSFTGGRELDMDYLHLVFIIDQYSEPEYDDNSVPQSKKSLQLYLLNAKRSNRLMPMNDRRGRS